MQVKMVVRNWFSWCYDTKWRDDMDESFRQAELSEPVCNG